MSVEEPNNFNAFAVIESRISDDEKYRFERNSVLDRATEFYTSRFVLILSAAPTLLFTLLGYLFKIRILYLFLLLALYFGVLIFCNETHFEWISTAVLNARRLVASCDEARFHSFVSDTMRDLKGDSPFFRARSFRIFYVRPHYRLKEEVDGKENLEWKRVLSSRVLYHDGSWFKFVESEETPFSEWSHSRTARFLENAGHFACPVSVEFRHELSSEDFPNLKMYAFRKPAEGGRPRYGVVFEMEAALLDRRAEDPAGMAFAALRTLSLFGRYYRIFRSLLPFTSSSEDLQCVRKPVVPLHPSRALEMFQRSSLSFNSENLLIAPKRDGIFGFVHVRGDRIRELWEDNLQRVRRCSGSPECPPDLVFGAERMPDGSAILLDVYRFGPHEVRTTESLLTEFLPRLSPPHLVQTYRRARPSDAARVFSSSCSSEDWVLHDVAKDVVYKLKRNHTVDLVHYEGFFWMPDGVTRKPAPEGLLDGSVYECSLDFAPLRRRDDRFFGNSAAQWSQILSAAALPNG